VRPRRPLVALGLAIALSLLLLVTPALADHDPRTSVDPFIGIGFDAGVEAGPLTRAYPPAHYKLDINVGDPGALDVERHLEKMFHLAAAAVWNFTTLLMLGMISVFMWAFSFGVLERGLAGVGEASEMLYRDVVGREWLIVAILLAGLWGIWKALVQRRYVESAGAMTLSVCFAVAALFFVYRPVTTITQASYYGDQMSNAFLSVASVGPEPAGGVGPRRPGTAGTTKAKLSDRLFKAFVYDPWVVLNFGGLVHCVDARDQPTGHTRPERPGERCVDHRTAYAPHWLRYSPYSDERKAEYQALNQGKIPEQPGRLDRLRGRADALIGEIVPSSGGLFSSDEDAVKPAPGQFAGRAVSRVDEPAVDIQQEGAGLDRLALALIVFVGNLGAVLLLGALSLGIVLAQIIALLLVAFAPVALIAAIFPGRGHDFFRAWGRRLIEAVLRKAIYSLVIAVILAILSALFIATTALPWGIAFAFQSAFLWMIFLGRHQIAGRLTGAGSESRPSSRAHDVLRAPAARAGALGVGAAGLMGGGIGYGVRRAEDWRAHRRAGGADGSGAGQRALHAGTDVPEAPHARVDDRRGGLRAPEQPVGRAPVEDPARVAPLAPRADRSLAAGARGPGRAGDDGPTSHASNGATPDGAGPRGGADGAPFDRVGAGASVNGRRATPERIERPPQNAQTPAALAAHSEQRILRRQQPEPAPPTAPTRGRAPWSGLRGRSRRS
jgi:hypothetical protein